MTRLHAERLPGYCFLIALCILCPLQWLCVSSSVWFREPPKPIGDGPDYENIAYHLWQGSGFVIDSTAPGWRVPYERSSHDYGIHLGSPPRTLPTTGRPPLFPMFVAAIYALLGRDEWGFAAVRLFSASCLAVAGALAVKLTAELLIGQCNQACRETTAERGKDGEGALSTEDGTGVAAKRQGIVGQADATFTERKGTVVVLAGAGATLLLLIVNRTLRDYPTDFLTEPLALLLMQCFVLLAIRVCTPKYHSDRDLRAATASRSVLYWLQNNQFWWLSLLAGVTWGALILTRSMFVVWLPIIWLLFVLSVPRPFATRLKAATLIVGVAGLVCAPWWVRNCIVLQQWMPLGTQGPTTLLGGYSDEALLGNGDWQSAPELRLRRELSQRPDYQALANDSAREALVAHEASQRVRAWIWSHWSALPRLAARRIYVHWNPYSGASLLWKLPLIVGAMGLVVLRARAAYWLLGLPLTSTLVVAAFYSTGGRFLIPLYGVLFSLAGLGVAYTVLLIQVRILGPRRMPGNNSAQPMWARD